MSEESLPEELLEQLRDIKSWDEDLDPLCKQAADEIERLRALIQAEIDWCKDRMGWYRAHNPIFEPESPMTLVDLFEKRATFLEHVLEGEK